MKEEKLLVIIYIHNVLCDVNNKVTQKWIIIPYTAMVQAERVKDAR